MDKPPPFQKLMKFGIMLVLTPKPHLKVYIDRMVSFWKKRVTFMKILRIKGSHLISNNHNFWISGPIWKNKVFFNRGKTQELNFYIIFMFRVNFGVMTFSPMFWHWNWPRGSKYKWLMAAGYRSPMFPRIYQIMKYIIFFVFK